MTYRCSNCPRIVEQAFACVCGRKYCKQCLTKIAEAIIDDDAQLLNKGASKNEG